MVSTYSKSSIKSLALAVIKSAVTDLGSSRSTERLGAERFLEGDGFSLWCWVYDPDVNPETVKERLLDACK